MSVPLGVRLVRGKRLFFGLAFGAHRGLEREASGVLSGDVFDGSVARYGGCGVRRSAALESEDDLPDFDLLAFLDFDLFDYAADGRGNFNDGLVGLQFHHGLAFGNSGPE